MIAVLVALLSAGCAAASGTSPDPSASSGGDTGSEALGTLRVLVRPESRGQRMPLASAQGRLGGRVGDNGTACLWVEAGGVRTVLVWPHGYAAADNPLRVLDAEGNTVATVGDQVRVTGGATPSSYTPDPEVVAACEGSEQRLFAVHAIRG